MRLSWKQIVEKYGRKNLIQVYPYVCADLYFGTDYSRYKEGLTAAKWLEEHPEKNIDFFLPSPFKKQVKYLWVPKAFISLENNSYHITDDLVLYTKDVPGVKFDFSRFNQEELQTFKRKSQN